MQINYEYKPSQGRISSKLHSIKIKNGSFMQFYAHESFQVQHRIITNFVQPMSRNDVKVTVVGLGFNTR